MELTPELTPEETEIYNELKDISVDCFDAHKSIRLLAKDQFDRFSLLVSNITGHHIDYSFTFNWILFINKEEVY